MDLDKKINNEIKPGNTYMIKIVFEKKYPLIGGVSKQDIMDAMERLHKDNDDIVVHGYVIEDDKKTVEVKIERLKQSEIDQSDYKNTVAGKTILFYTLITGLLGYLGLKLVDVAVVRINNVTRTAEKRSIDLINFITVPVGIYFLVRVVDIIWNSVK
ncbi:MAG: hypothetical protein ACOCRX_03285 [Candidatus Woesearchaeota archaeon]